MDTKPKEGKGRPRFEPDLAKVEQLAALQCTYEEIAAVIGCSLRTVKTLAKCQDFQDAYERGKEKGRASLRRMQWKTAEGGNTAMLIWLGKQMLGQAEKQEVKQETNSRSVVFIAPDEYESPEAWEAAQRSD